MFKKGRSMILGFEVSASTSVAKPTCESTKQPQDTQIYADHEALGLTGDINQLFVVAVIFVSLRMASKVLELGDRSGLGDRNGLGHHD